LGNQKSGTSAIAHLLARFGGLTKTVDIPETWWPALGELLSGRLGLQDLANRHPHRFASDLIKEPNLTFLYAQVRDLHPDGSFLFVVRDPRDNVRSMLNRIKVPGHLSSLDLARTEVSSHWRPVFDPDLWSLPTGSSHYVEVLAARWNRAADVYLEHREEMLLVRYEDFLADKAGMIQGLALRLGVPQRNMLGGGLDIQYQPRGQHGISWMEFFGSRNLLRIENTCAGRMQELGYSPSSTRGDFQQ
jgi:hypothetical protein